MPGLQVVRQSQSDWLGRGRYRHPGAQHRRLGGRVAAGLGLHHRPAHPGRRPRRPRTAPSTSGGSSTTALASISTAPPPPPGTPPSATMAGTSPSRPGSTPPSTASGSGCPRRMAPTPTQPARLRCAELRAAPVRSQRRHPLPQRDQRLGDHRPGAAHEACSPIVARHTAAAQDCEYEVAWSNTYQVGIDYAATATRCGNTVLNRHRAPASRHLRLLGSVRNVRAAAFRHSATEIGVEGLAVVATSTTSATTLAGLSFNGLDDITPTARGLLLEAQRGLAFVVDCSQTKEFALVHSLVGGADGGRISCAASMRR